MHDDLVFNNVLALITHNEIYKTFGNRLLKIVLDLNNSAEPFNYTMDELAELSNCCRRTINRNINAISKTGLLKITVNYGRKNNTYKIHSIAKNHNFLNTVEKHLADTKDLYFFSRKNKSD